MTRRSEKVNDLLRDEISEIVQRDLKDPRLAGLISITAVEASPDFRHARVFVSVLGSEEERASSLKALNAGAGFIKRDLRARLRSLRTVPELAFKADTSLERGAHLAALLHQVAEELPATDGKTDSGQPEPER
jgi:ribosome-binding factor A